MILFQIGGENVSLPVHFDFTTRRIGGGDSMVKIFSVVVFCTPNIPRLLDTDEEADAGIQLTATTTQTPITTGSKVASPQF